ncbi:Putative fluoride-specific ion channel FluC [Colletotrichum destructivum]|uniref:Fluoride-specific ion channel FluC n=1 Tax=Colletotrichum destructivum TaxID=34406 RepID=A0AAX4HVV1_9PEZI|nr:Putative fluoride-specific ion channel FluC [Colletotrichum destructivum]
MQNGSIREHDATIGHDKNDVLDDGLVDNNERRGTFGSPSLTGRRANTNASRTRSIEHGVPDDHETLDGTCADPVGHSPSKNQPGKGQSLEDIRSDVGRGRRPSDLEMMQDDRRDERDGTTETPQPPAGPATHVSNLASQVYTLSYLVFFAILGTLARLGVQALTTYPGAPVSFGVLWANVGGSLIMGFLAEDRKLFKQEWGAAMYHDQVRGARRQSDVFNSGGGAVADLAAAKKAHLAIKKTIPLYIGLATGFCGSFTSFSSFIRDVFLAVSNDLPGADRAAPEARGGGDSFMAALAVTFTTVALSLSALIAGAHLATALEPITPSLSSSRGRGPLNHAAVVLGWGAWLGAVLLAVFPPRDAWRGQAVFSLVFAPLGCVARFYVSLWLNSRAPAFPLGTFAVNVTGAAVLGACWNLGHAEIGGVVGCQVLQGVEDGFCGCLTTVSTWVAELTVLRRRHAYVYGVSSVVAGFAVLVVIMGTMRWTEGFGPLMCIH